VIRSLVESLNSCHLTNEDEDEDDDSSNSFRTVALEYAFLSPSKFA